MTDLHYGVRCRSAGKFLRLHTDSGGARERWDVLSAPGTRTKFSSNAMLSPEDRGLATAVTGGGGSAAMRIRQPTQHEPMQILLLASSGEGAG